MSLFRALREKNEGQMEVSERALALTDMLVHMNPANYTVWPVSYTHLTLPTTPYV
mgnify:CR=1 FL=1